MNTVGKIIDSHIHLDILHRLQPDRINWMRENEYVPISWAFGGRPKSREDLIQSLQRHAEFIRDLNQQDFICFYLSGIHPRCIPPDLRPVHVENIIIPFLEDPLCLGIGEIGLETGDAIEVDIFSAQLALKNHVGEKNKKIGIHTPRNNKAPLTEYTLSILNTYTDVEKIAVIDHCSPDTISPVLAKGFHAGLTLSPEKTSMDDLNHIIQNHFLDLDRIMCNTDSGGRFYDDLYQFSTSTDVSPDIRDKLCSKTAHRFFINSGA